MSRSYCFTLNNYTFEDIQNFEEMKCRYLIYGYEVGENGTPHLQGYVELANAQRLTAMKKINNKAHWEVRKGTRDEARNYCMKDNEFTEVGSWAAGGQGKRNDLKVVMDAIKGNMKTLELFDTFPNEVSRNMRFVEKYKELVEREQTKKFRKVNVEVIIGQAGHGKTKKAFDENPDVFTVTPSETFPFDGYDGEECILIDDFYGDLKYHQILRILDGHQLRVNVKGSHRYARWTKVYITSNKPPEEWYQIGLTPALKRRLNTVTTLCNEETGNTSPSLETITVDELLCI